MRAHLSAIPLLAAGTADLQSASLERLWVKPGRHFHASYRVALRTDAGIVDTRAAACVLRDARTASAAYRAALEAPAPSGTASNIATWEAGLSATLLSAPPMLLQLFPWDYRLPTLALALDARRVGRELNPTVLSSCEIVGYWPGMRCHLRYGVDAGDGLPYGKVFPVGAGDAPGRSHDAIARSLGAGASLATPRVRAYLPALNLLITEPIGGVSLNELLRRGEDGDAVPRVAEALAAFHELPAVELERHFGSPDRLALR